MSKIAIIGSGPAGLTTAYRLKKKGYQVTIFEKEDVIGGRTYSKHLEPGHHIDTGAGFLATFYRDTFQLFDEIGYNREMKVKTRTIRGASDVVFPQDEGSSNPLLKSLPFSIEDVKNSNLLNEEEREKFIHYLEELQSSSSGLLEPELEYDDRSANEEFSPLGQGVMNILVPMFEGPFFTTLDLMSAAMIRLWLKAIFFDCTFFQVGNGMDDPWKYLAEEKIGMENIRTNSTVQQISIVKEDSSEKVNITFLDGKMMTFDGCVVAVPAPQAVNLFKKDDLPIPWMKNFQYSPQVRVYGSQESKQDANIGYHYVQPSKVVTVEFFSGTRGAWGNCPEDSRWVLICAQRDESKRLLEENQEEASKQLWEEGIRLVPQLYSFEENELCHLMRWKDAVPIIGPGHYKRIDEYRKQAKPPIVLAGDWLAEACIEGAVRSGEFAASVWPELSE